MQNRLPQSSPESEQGLLLLMVCAFAFLCWLFFDSFVYGTSWVLYWLWMLVDFPRIHVWAGTKINLLANLANHAKEVTFYEWLEVMNQTSGILMIFLIPIVFFSALVLGQHPMLPFRSRRFVNIHTLPKIVSAFAPAVIPVMAASGPDGLMNDTSPENAWGQWPEELAEQDNLVKRQVLDREAARASFEAQIGRPHAGREGWEPHERALLAVFGAQVFLNDRKAALRLLDDLNRSCLIKGFLGRKQGVRPPRYSLANKLFARVANSDGFSELLEIHGYVRTALVGLYGRDLRLPPAKYRWLKGVDRTLWYALHTADTAKVYPEGTGVVAQARAESRARELSLPRPGLLVTKAIDGLQSELEGIGEVFPLEIKAPRLREVAMEAVVTAVYSTDEPPVTDDA
ncbi:conjugal transfer protein [Pseudomonas sp. MWU12-2115]|uniref:secretion/conjugation apparatus DotM-related subunit n=1 Tax=unclassified Pseudomonas TaxID=196821 RepID=UPI000CD53AB4|nr:conjugal transfer protein [Pseudomonas sp. MWU12-2020]RBB97341.1 conjugal transfer protein [Pseudomonas sp. MWU12-2115]